jgi:hypothetical protein
MKFVCLISAESCLDQMSEADAAAHLDEYRTLIDRLRRNGNYVECRRLMPAETAVTLRVRNHRVAVTDGPFAETKEQLGGFLILEARNIEEAVELAADVPAAKFGSIEIRPLADDAPTLDATGVS